MEGTSLHQRGRSVGASAVAVAFLAVSLALAAVLASSRGLADPVAVPGWAITFQPPRGWEKVETTPQSPAEVLRFRELAPAGTGRELLWARLPNPRDWPAGQVCLETARQLLGVTPHPAMAQLQAGKLGPLPGASLLLPHGAYLQAGVHVTAAGEEDAYVMILLSRRPLEQTDIRFADLLAGAVRLRAD